MALSEAEFSSDATAVGDISFLWIKTKAILVPRPDSAPKKEQQIVKLILFDFIERQEFQNIFVKCQHLAKGPLSESLLTIQRLHPSKIRMFDENLIRMFDENLAEKN